MSVQAVNPFQPAASTVAASTVAFIEANRSADKASTPFARSTLAAVVGGLSSLSMVESLVIAAFGSPKGKNGKPVAKVSGLRDFDGGARLYQAWKAVAFIVDNLDADAPTEQTRGEETATIGEGAIRAAVTAFILQDDGAATALFGATGIAAKVKALMADHAKAIADFHGIVAEGEGEGEGEGDKSDAPAGRQSLTDRANAMLLALREASDADVAEALDALAILADYIDQRTAPTMEAPQEVREAA